MISLLHTLLSPFAGGRSTAKASLLLLCLALFAIFRHFFYQEKIGKHIKKVLCTFVILITLLSLSGLGGHLYLTRHFNLTAGDFFVVFNNGEISSSQLLHNHTLKSMGGFILSKAGYSYFENTDTGTAFIGLLPTWFIFFNIVLFLGAVICIFSILSWLASEKTIKKGSVYIVGISLAILSSFSALTSIIDGGFFTQTLLPSFIFFIAIVLWWNSQHFNWKKIYLAYFLYCILIFFLLISVYAHKDVSNHISYFYGSVGLFFLYASLIKIFLEKDRHWTSYGFLVISMLLIWSGSTGYRDLLDYKSQKIEDSGAIIASYATIPGQEVIGSIGNLTYYNITKEFKTVSQALSTFDLLDNYYPISVPWKDCFPKGRRESLSFKLIVKEGVEPLNQSNALFSFKTIKNSDTHYKGLFEINACLPRDINALDEVLKIQGLEPAIVYDVKLPHQNE